MSALQIVSRAAHDAGLEVTAAIYRHPDGQCHIATRALLINGRWCHISSAISAPEIKDRTLRQYTRHRVDPQPNDDFYILLDRIPERSFVVPVEALKFPRAVNMYIPTVPLPDYRGRSVRVDWFKYLE